MYYKFLKRNTNGLVSCTMKNTSSAVIYTPGVFVSPPDILLQHGFGLFVFDDIELLRDFIKTNFCYPSAYEAWTCECEGPLPLPPQLYEEETDINNPNHFSADNIIPDSVSTWPAGSITFSKVKLLERIPYESLLQSIESR